MSDKPVKRDSIHIITAPNGTAWPVPEELANVLLRQGIAPSAVGVPDIVYHAKVKWEDLCVLTTRDRRTLVSPILVITLIDANPDAPAEFQGYKGVVRFEFSSEVGAASFATHAMFYAATGESTPLWAWLKVQVPPFLARIAYVETRNAERHVVRPAPWDIEVI